MIGCSQRWPRWVHLAEVNARGASVAAVANDNDSIKTVADYVLRVPATQPLFSPRCLARELERNVDSPRDLAKMATME